MKAPDRFVEIFILRNADGTVAGKFVDDGHGMPGHWPVFFANIGFAGDGLAEKHVSASVGEPQNFLEFCGAESIHVARFPDDVVQQSLELVAVKLHGDHRASRDQPSDTRRTDPTLISRWRLVI